MQEHGFDMQHLFSVNGLFRLFKLDLLVLGVIMVLLFAYCTVCKVVVRCESKSNWTVMPCKDRLLTDKLVHYFSHQFRIFSQYCFHPTIKKHSPPLDPLS